MVSFETELFISKLKQMYGDKYDYTFIKYINTDTPVKVVCNKCKKIENVTPKLLLRGKYCKCWEDKPIRVLVNDTKEEFIRKAKLKYGDKYNYDKVVYYRSNQNVIITCNKHGDFLQTPYNHLISKNGGCRECLKERAAYTKEDFINMSNNIHNNKYNYDKVDFVDMQTAVTIICPTHGEFKQKPVYHINSMGGCKFCASEHLKTTRAKPQEEFIKECSIVHKNKYDYSKTVYVNSYTNVTIICPEHGEFSQKPNAHLSGSECPKCAKQGQTKSNDTFINQLKTYRGDEFTYEKTQYVNANTKVTVTCPKHGDLEVHPGHLLFNKNPFRCPKCVLDDKQISFMQRAKAIHGDKYDYSKSIYVKNREPLEIICSEHGSFWQTPNNHLAGSGCKLCSSSTPELTIYKFLNNHGVKTVREHTIENYKYRYDFYLPDFNILIEYHGAQHYNPCLFNNGVNSDTLEDRRLKDKIKSTIAEEKNIPLIVLSYLDDKQLTQILKIRLNSVYKYKYDNKYFRKLIDLYKYIQEKTGREDISKEEAEQYRIDKIID